MASRLFLIDGHALIFKMYYAFLRRPMINSKGADMSILFGFTKYILELIDREQPTHLAVAFDPPGGTFRNEMYPEYKANRAETPQLVIDALEPLTELLKAMNIPVLCMPGFEADDVIGSMAKRFASDDMDVYMVTPDKDYGQLIDSHVYQVKPGKSGSENELVDVAAVCARYGISSPSQVIDMLTICGDTADNVPGVKGVGEVWAGKLIAQYGSVDNIYEHIDELTDKQILMFRNAQDHIQLSKALVTIKTDIKVPVKEKDMLVDMDFNPSIANLFKKYEFNSLNKYIAHISSGKATKENKAADIPQIPVREVEAYQIAQFACSKGKCSVFVETETAGIFGAIKSITIAAVDKDDSIVAATGNASDFKRLLEDPVVTKYGFDIKLQMNVLAHAGVSFCGKLRDVELMHYILDPEKSHKLDIIAQHYLGIRFDDTPAEPVMGSLFDDTASFEPEKNHFQEAAALLLCGQKIWNELQQAKMLPLYEDIEGPLVRVLSKMERTGVKVDVASLREFADQLRAQIAENESFVRQLSGNETINLSSPKQVGELVFETLKLDPKAKKNSKGSWSTDEETLLALREQSPVIDAILDYRAAKKLLSTYIEPFPGYISPYTGRIHTTFNQALTSTGRLSSSNPNLQNIPIRTELGKSIRKAFIGEGEKTLIMSADYSQIELRIMAHLSCDEHLISAFKQGVDVHAATAAKIFGIPLEEVTSDQRRIAKTANFGIMYGISAFGLAQRLGISRTDAKKIIDDYFESFPSISSFIEATLEAARENGYVETVFGRRRYIQDINSSNGTMRALAERNAVNAPIQGTSADIIKLAMIAVDKRMSEAHLKSRMVLQIHDELLFETYPDEVEVLKQLVTEEMQGVVKLSVPLTVECNYGENWLEAH